MVTGPRSGPRSAPGSGIVRSEGVRSGAFRFRTAPPPGPAVPAILPVLVVAVLVVAVLLAGALTASAAEGPALEVGTVRVEPGTAGFQLAARDLPDGVSLDPAKITVTADGIRLPASATATGTGSGAGRSPGAVPARDAGLVVVMVFDASGSMAGRPLVEAVDAALKYAAAVPAGVRIGLVAVGDRAETVLDPTTDRGRFTTAVRRLRAGGETALYDGVERAATLAGREKADEKRLLVLSDGADTVSTTSLDLLALRLQSTSTVVDVVAFGTRTDRAALARIAEAGGGGRLLRADQGRTLTDAFLSAAETISERLHVTLKVPAALAGRRTRLEIEAWAGGRAMTATAPVVFAADPAAAAPPRAADVTGPAGWLYPAGTGALMVGLALIVVAVTVPRPGIGTKRLAEVDRFAVRRIDPARRPGSALPVPMPAAALHFSDRMVRARGRHEQIATQLEQAGMRLLPREWALVRVAGALAGLLVVGFLLSPLLGVLLGPVLGWWVCGRYRRRRANRRIRRFEEQLPESLMLVVGSLRSGFSLAQALIALVRESPEPVSGEFGRALAETRIGVGLEDALERTAERVGSRDLSWLVMAIRIQREVGGNLAEIMETAVETMRERARLRRHVRALTAEGRLSAYVLLGLPICLGSWMFLMRGEYVRPLYTEPMGIAMLVFAVVMVCFGAFWMSRLIKVEV